MILAELLRRRGASGGGIDYSLYENQYLTTEALETGTITFNIPDGVTTAYISSISYRKNGGSWTTTTNSSSTIDIAVSVVEGDIIEWKGIIPRSNRVAGAQGYTAKFVSNGASFNLYGNLLSLYWDDNFIGQTVFPYIANNAANSLGAYALFKETNVVDASNFILPILQLTGKTLNVDGYQYAEMFRNCTSLVLPPAVLPATLIGNYSYQYMFAGCTSMTTMPNMESIQDTAANGRSAYYNMFAGCSTLQYNTQQTIHINRVGYQGCSGMFQNCISMVNAPNIEVYEYGNGVTNFGVAQSFYAMFSGCTSLQTPPERIDLTEVDRATFMSMFANCTSLQYAPIINIRSVAVTDTPAYQGFQEMFTGCTALTNASGINVYFPTTSEWNGYRTFASMFNGCTALVHGPSIQINGTLISQSQRTFYYLFFNCGNMTTHDVDIDHDFDANATIDTGNTNGNYYIFYHCTKIRTSPRIARRDLKDYEFYRAFDGCTQLRNVYVDFDTDTAGTALNSWLANCGTISGVTRRIYQAGTLSLPTGSTSGIPNNWTGVSGTWPDAVRMTLYLDRFPISGVEGQYREGDESGMGEYIEHELGSPRSCDADEFIYDGDTVTISNVTYFVWNYRIKNQGDGFVGYKLLTTTDNFYELTKASLIYGYDTQLEHLGKNYDWLYGMLTPDGTALYYSKEGMISDETYLLSVERTRCIQ